MFLISIVYKNNFCANIRDLTECVRNVKSFLRLFTHSTGHGISDQCIASLMHIGLRSEHILDVHDACILCIWLIVLINLFIILFYQQPGHYSELCFTLWWGHAANILDIFMKKTDAIQQPVGIPPETLNTLQKLTDSINNDKTFYSTSTGLLKVTARQMM